AKSQNAEVKPKASPETSASVTAKADSKADAAPKSSAKASPPQTTAERVPSLAELPDDVRRQVPALKLGGLVYSAAPASRMVLVNGDVQREGSTVAPGLTLERINPKSAVFALRGQRFEVPL
ncbi:MAG: general secretion pathway protein GspB, partial [Burkholderiaceae bacterium]|nr:general secretion pathway protein GspB [Burkholderiaceae bacterium]